MSGMVRSHATLRIFAFSIVATIAALAFVQARLGARALLVAAVLVVIETAFSFDNAIINAKILERLSRFWQNFFLSVGIVIAVFGMRIVFPIVLVMLTAGLGRNEVVSLALHNPHEYAKALEHAHPSIAAFGGAFLMMLALQFFLDDSREVRWLAHVETFLQKLAGKFSSTIIVVITVSIFAALPANHYHRITLISGLLGIGAYVLLYGITRLIERKAQPASGGRIAKLTGMAAFMTFVYLEFLDANFSFDGVIGAFAITSNVVLIALGLGVGALWVRSLTVFMVRRGTLDQYKYLDHGAYYTVAALALILFMSSFFHFPDILSGLLGIVFIAASIVASLRAKNQHGT